MKFIFLLSTLFFTNFLISQKSDCEPKAIEEYQKVTNLINKAQEYAKTGDFASETKLSKEALEKSIKIQNKYKCYSVSAFWQLTDAYIHKGEFANALINANEGLQHCVKFNLDCEYIQYSRYKVASVYLAEGNDSLAKLELNKSLDACDGNGLKFIEALSFVSKGDIEFQKGNFALALNNYERAEEIANAIGSKYNTTDLILGRCYYGIGSVILEQGSCDEALTKLLASLHLAEDAFDNITLSKCYNKIGYVYYHKSKYYDAITNFEKGNVISKKMNHFATLVDSYIYLGWIYLTFEDLNNAALMTQYSLDIAKTNKLKIGLVDAYNLEGALLRKQKSFEFLTKSKSALVIASDFNYTIGIVDAYTNLTDYYYDQKEYPISLKYAKIALRLSDSIGYHQAATDALNSIGNIMYKYYSKSDSAFSYYYKALNRSEKGSYKICGTYLQGKVNSYNNIALIYKNKGKKDKAYENYAHASEIADNILYKEGKDIAKNGESSVKNQYLNFDRK
jgi:tetratricopeptide (TPR) repeat protein